MRNYFEIALEYAWAVISGDIPACLYTRQACQRQLDDLNRDGFKYRFNVEKSHRICLFIEKMKHTKGKWAGKKIELEPWQIFILTTVFGWVDENGNRRFKTVYEEVPRKNAKSTKLSGIGLYLTFADGEAGAEVYSAATTRDQAKIVWQDAKRMAQKSGGFRKRFNVKIASNAIFSEESASAFKALSRDSGGNLDGLNVHGGLIDELHGHKTRDVFDVIETATGAREQPLIWQITTAGNNRAGICYEQRSYAIKILSGAVEDDSYFAIIFTIDEGDDWTDPAVWQKANPNWNVSVNPEDIERKARKAAIMPSAQNNFLTKHLNVWVNADVSWMNMAAWDQVGSSSLRIEDFYGCPCYIALDLASKIDIASKAYVFELEDKIVLFVKNYLPEEAIESSRNSQYAGWAKEEKLTVTSGAMIDFKRIEDELVKDSEQFNVIEVSFDPWQANYLGSNLLTKGLNVVFVAFTTKHMSDAMKEVEGRVINKTLIHNACPVMSWMMSNVVCHTDVRDNIFPRKEKPENKIDGPVAAIMAIARWLVARPEIDPFIDLDEIE